MVSRCLLPQFESEMSDSEHLAFMNLRLVSFPFHQRPCGNEDFDFRETDARGLSRMKHRVDECNLENWELYELRKYGLGSLGEFVAIIAPLYTEKEVANMSADYFFRDVMSIMPREAHYKAEVVDFLVQDCFQMDDSNYNVCLDKAEVAAMIEWVENHYSIETDDLKVIFERAREAFVAYAPDTIPDVILARYAISAANNIVIDIMKS
jgi:hypothetical protein